VTKTKTPHLQQGGTNECVPADLAKVFEAIGGDEQAMLNLIALMDRMLARPDRDLD
jgi:hypothetical protein